MHYSVSLIFAVLQTWASTVSNITVEDHGKTILFQRYRRIGPFKVPYYHKGIIFFPSVCEIDGLLESDSSHIISDHPHVVHLFGKSKRYAKVRIDPVEGIVGKYPFEIISDTDSCYKKDQCVRRAMKEVGEDHRGLGYNLLANNCGMFVAWAKHGSSDADTQVRDFIENLRVMKRPLLFIHKRLIKLFNERAIEHPISE
jgi:hypothetical protein